MSLERARAAEAQLADARRTAWNRDPGNTGMAHLTMTAWDYHEAYKRWERAHVEVVRLEAELRRLLEEQT
jgi:hypothetical protein